MGALALVWRTLGFWGVGGRFRFRVQRFLGLFELARSTYEALHTFVLTVEEARTMYEIFWERNYNGEFDLHISVILFVIVVTFWFRMVNSHMEKSGVALAAERKSPPESPRVAGTDASDVEADSPMSSVDQNEESNLELTAKE